MWSELIRMSGNHTSRWNYIVHRKLLQISNCAIACAIQFGKMQPAMTPRRPAKTPMTGI
jgi:hypothetical protein